MRESTHLGRFLLIPPLSGRRLGHLFDGLFDMLPLPIQIALSAVRGCIVVGLRLRKHRVVSDNVMIRVFYRLPLWNAFAIKSRGRRKLNRGNAGRSIHYVPGTTYTKNS